MQMIARRLLKVFWPALATVVAVFLSQLPYYRTWLYGSPMPFDGFFGFPSWFVSQINDLLVGNHPFSIRSDLIPGLVAPPYSGAGVVRLILNLFFSNDMAAHAMIQCVHIALTVLAVAGLCSTFAISWEFGLLGGLLFIFSGVQVSLSQHVVAHEAHFYFVAALLTIRLLVREVCDRNRRGRAALYSALIALSATGLAWFFHDPIHYFLPLALWTIGHVIENRSALRADGRMKKLLFYLSCPVAAAAALVIPNLFCALEMAPINKSQVSEFAGGQSYPAPLLLAGLFLPHVTAGLDIKGLDFTFGDANLFYFFMGTFTVFLNFCFIAGAWRRSEWLTIGTFFAALTLAFGFALGAGHILHYLICVAFPPLGYLRHNFYGLTVLYLLCAFGVARGLQEFVTNTSQNYFLILMRAVAFHAAVLLFFLNYMQSSYWSLFRTSFIDFLSADLTRYLVMNLLFAVILGLYRFRPRWRVVVAALFCALCAYDLIRPTLWQHFLPQEEVATSYTDFSGALAPAKPYIEYFQKQKAGGAGFSFRPLRVFSKDVWLWPDHLYPVGVANVSTLDSQGSADFERRYAEDFAAQMSTTISQLAEEYGIDYFWLGAQDNSLHQSLRANNDYLFGIERAWLGSIYQYKFGFDPLFRYSDSGMLLRWFLPASIIQRSDSLFGSLWKITLPEPIVCRGNAQISLPIMWLSMFSVRSPEGTEIEFSRDSHGRISVPCDNRAAHLTLIYPKPSVKNLIKFSHAIKAILLVMSVILIPVVLILLTAQIFKLTKV